MNDDILTKIQESEKKLFVCLAGPGTGKSYLFKTIIESNEYAGKNVLILSFINKLVDDLSEEFTTFSNVKISTLHAFAKKCIGKIDLDPDLDNIISEDYFFIKNQNIKYDEKFYENNLTKTDEDFYKKRKNFYKYKNNLYSFNSTIYALNLYLTKDKSKIPNYDIILIDEFQDFNKLECKLIEILNIKSKIIVVGDDDQSLYSFKKAQPEYIRNLYNSKSCESFSLDYCRRCTKVIVETVNQLIKKAKNRNLLKDRIDKKFLYAEENNESKNIISKNNPKIDFLSAINGDLLISKLANKIKIDLNNENKRILILAPSYLRQTLFEGLIKKGFVITNYELFSKESKNKFSHKSLINIFETLCKRKTDNLSLRKILRIYLDKKRLKNVLMQTNDNAKKIWNYLNDEEKKIIDSDILLFKKVKSGEKNLIDSELLRFNELFNLKNILSKLIIGFENIKPKPIEIEVVTTISSKGLSSDLVYYLGIDDENILDKKTKKITESKLCEFLVGITRTKEKLTLISLKDKSPKILDFIDKENINKI